MKYKKVVFFVDPAAPHTEDLKSVLGQDFSCFHSDNVDEFSQTFHQSGPFALVFTDAKSAVTFFKEPDKELFNLVYKIYLYLPVNGVFNPEAQKKLNSLKINVYPLREKESIIKDIRKFMAGDGDKSAEIEGLEFMLPGDE